MKRNKYLYSDPHFGHDNIIKYCDRPYQNSQEMDEALIKNYNMLVRTNDIVFWLGDVGLPGAPRLKEILSRMNGTKILILGNHDKYGINTYYDVGFTVVLETAMIQVGQRVINLSHYPQRSFGEIIRLFWIYVKKMKEKGRSFAQVIQRIKKEMSKYQISNKNWTLCGHVHNAWKIHKNNLNMSVDVWDYKPVSIDKIVQLIDKEENERRRR